MLSEPKKDDKQPEQGVRRGSPTEPSSDYTAGQRDAEMLMQILSTSLATNGALRQALHEVMARGRPERFRGFTDALQTILQPEGDDR